MTIAILRLVLAVIAGIKLPLTLEALFLPTKAPRATWLKMTASLCFLVGACLMTVASLLWVLTPWHRTSETIGSGALAVLAGFIFFGNWCRWETRRALATREWLDLYE